MKRFVIVLVLLTPWACRPQRESPRATPFGDAAKPLPGEEPLETESIGSEEVRTLPAERIAAPPQLGPCSWSSVWQNEDVPDPHLAGVNGLPMPVRTSGSDILIPGNRPEQTSEIHAEIVIGPFGAVLEATIVHAPEPRWPEAEQAILDTVRNWRYEPQTLRGEPITVCSTLVLKP